MQYSAMHCNKVLCITVKPMQDHWCFLHSLSMDQTFLRCSTKVNRCLYCTTNILEFWSYISIQTLQCSIAKLVYWLVGKTKDLDFEGKTILVLNDICQFHLFHQNTHNMLEHTHTQYPIPLPLDILVLFKLAKVCTWRGQAHMVWKGFCTQSLKDLTDMS